MAIDVAPATTAGIVWQGSDALRLRITGSVMVDASDDEDRALFDSLTPGRAMEVRAAVVVTGAGIQWARDRNGDAAGVVAQKMLTVESIWPSD